MVPALAGPRRSSSPPSSVAPVAPSRQGTGLGREPPGQGEQARGPPGPPPNQPLRSPSEWAALMEERQLLPFPEWHIDFSEIKLGIRVGVGKLGIICLG